MKRALRLGLGTLVAGAVVFGVWRGASHRNRRQDLASALKLAGYKEDDAGRIILTPDAGGLALAFDPNLYDPTTGFRACMGRITACLDATKHVDGCVRDAPRCLSSTPWKNDPAGEGCCPESCVQPKAVKCQSWLRRRGSPLVELDWARFGHWGGCRIFADESGLFRPKYGRRTVSNVGRW